MMTDREKISRSQIFNTSPIKFSKSNKRLAYDCTLDKNFQIWMLVQSDID